MSESYLVRRDREDRAGTLFDVPAWSDGETFEPGKDKHRLRGQYARVFVLMSDRMWRSLSEIAAGAQGSEAGVSARLRDFRKPKNGAHTVNRRRRAEGGGGTWEYQLIVNKGAL